MISYVRGELAAVEEQKAIVDVGGIGYGIFMSNQALALLPQPGNEVKIYTYFSVREDAMQLFGFLTRDDLEIFRLVIGVSGIGPKGGLNILSGHEPGRTAFCCYVGGCKSDFRSAGNREKDSGKTDRRAEG